MRRKLTEAPKLDAEDLPDLTDQQRAFVEGLLAGKTASDAFRAAYDTSNMQQNTIWAAASRLRADSKVDAWLSAARQAHLGQGTVTLEGHIRELDRLKEIAIKTGNVGAAVQAEQLRGKAQGHYVERMDVTHHNSDALLDEIRQLSPELAEQLGATEH
jgi:hypothetical protein